MRNNKKSKSKEYFLYTLLALAGFVIWYISIAFVTLEINPEKWGEAMRSLFLMEGLITSTLIVAGRVLAKNNQK